ncbi:L-2-hydroxyglutarate oxidase [Mesorhizobium sp. CO1-1-8]|uniref:L-2-hydroxyglutarate oxidase n=1 Tax=Mesorhizobium sp. CO1-1-8 TaxID=2876631 RepID=UPI001CD0B5EB|nr:L-2-hydroxyglutarate oxidase [Mesorhizobium sp. CO1-1-8]MBZ9772518.1 L-2-hydroxyglutarate oxidase [Mesorhizobium sp. CO1-1-8]
MSGSRVAQPSSFEYCVIGGGIVGLATAMALSKRDPGARIVLLEKEGELAVHQTGHNSGVIHSGIYYQPDSLKSRLCREGAEATKAFCRAHNIGFDTCGKLLVATNDVELERMDGLQQRARQNGISSHHLTRDQLRAAEPAISGMEALLVPSTGIVDYRSVCIAMAQDLSAAGVEIRRGATVTAIHEDDTRIAVVAGGETVNAQRLVACAGLQSDRLARLAGLEITHRIVPFRGEYYVLPPSRAALVRHLIYPVPDPDLPFLGIHLTRMIDGSITVGPNAVLGLAREGYAKASFDMADIADMTSFPGFWRVLAANWRSGLRELKSSLSKGGYLEECRKYCPQLALADLAAPAAGIRAQAVLKDGTLVHDFLFVATERMLHVCNAPSPAATSAIPIGTMIAERLLSGAGTTQTVH